MTKPRDPIRVSARLGDRGFRSDAYRFDAYLDGKLLEDCRSADEEAGWAETYVRDHAGLFIMINGEYQMKEHRGKIEIKAKADAV